MIPDSPLRDTRNIKRPKSVQKTGETWTLESVKIEETEKAKIPASIPVETPFNKSVSSEDSSVSGLDFTIREIKMINKAKYSSKAGIPKKKAIWRYKLCGLSTIMLVVL